MCRMLQTIVLCVIAARAFGEPALRQRKEPSKHLGHHPVHRHAAPRSTHAPATAAHQRPPHPHTHKSSAVAAHAKNLLIEPKVPAGISTSHSELMLAYGVALMTMILIVSIMFYPMGAHVVGQVVLYVSCLAFVKIALKMVYEYHFNFPKFITAVHLLVSSSAAFVVLLHKRITTGKPIAIPTKDELFFGIIPIASTFGLSIASENSALVFVSASFSEVVASTNPVMSFVLAWLFGLGSNFQLLAPIAVVVFGCLISVSGELHFSPVGLALLFLSVFFRGIKAVMQQKLMTGETKDKFDPVTLMAWSCLFAFLVVGTYSIATEGMAPIEAVAKSADVVGLMVALLGSAAIACTLNISALFVIRQLGAVGMQMVSQMKAILVVVGGMALLGESFTRMQQLGFGIVLFGVYMFSRMQRSLNPNAKGH